MAVVGRGKEVVGLVTQAIEQLQAGNSKGATVLLSQLKSNASKLSDETQELLQQLHALQDYYKTEVEETPHKIGALSMEKNRLEETMQGARIDLQRKEDQLRDLQRQLSVAECSRDTARKERDEAESDKNRMIGTTVGVGVAGLLFSVATLGIGTPIAVAATTACGISASNYADKEDEAKRDIKRYNSQISDVSGGIAASRSRITHFEGQIRDLHRKVQEQEQECRGYEDDKKRIQNAIAFLQESQSFWGEFSVKLEHRSSKTEHLYHLLEMAEEKKQQNFFKHRGSQTMVMSFNDAWEGLREDVQSGSGHIFSVAFTCVQCQGQFTGLPFAMGKQFECTNCHRAICSK